MAIPNSEDEALVWLIENDPEAANLWRALISDKAAHQMMDAYWANVLDFGPEEDYTEAELEEFNRRLKARDGFKSWQQKEKYVVFAHHQTMKECKKYSNRNNEFSEHTT